ncbi:hypothetical protein BYT27DRAFT_7216814 [Phlegmacium glaucopus]|nr:hypothetical protein BYT27DRAFT_7216814 [Phlegmacium glaucopus]
MAKLPRRNARAKTLVRLYTKLQREYLHRKRHHILRLKRSYRLLQIPSTGNLRLSLSSLSSLSSNDASTPSLSSLGVESESGDITEDEDTASNDSWADVLGLDWQGRDMLGSDTSLDSEFGIDYNSDVSELISQGNHDSGLYSGSSRYGGDAESSFKSDMLEVSEDEDVDSDEEPSGDRWARLRRWVHQNIQEMYASRYEMSCGDMIEFALFGNQRITVLRNLSTTNPETNNF